MKDDSEIKPALLVETIQNELIQIPLLENIWLKPSEVASILGFSERTLANAREGNGSFIGPPYKKIGEGRTAAIRYPLKELNEYMNSFEFQNIHNNSPKFTRYSSFNSFIQNGVHDDLWPCILYRDGEISELFTAIKFHEKFLKEHQTRSLIWLRHEFIKLILQLKAE